MFATDDKRLIEMELHRLDCVACEMEAKWGIGNLYEWSGNEMKEKWDSQKKKLATAVEKEDYHEVCKFTNGTIRGWFKLEEMAIENGHKEKCPEYMEIKLDSGFKLRVARSSSEARMITEEGTYVWSLKEIASLIEKDYTLINKIKSDMNGLGHVEVSKVKKDFVDDEIPW